MTESSTTDSHLKVVVYSGASLFQKIPQVFRFLVAKPQTAKSARVSLDNAFATCLVVLRVSRVAFWVPEKLTTHPEAE